MWMKIGKKYEYSTSRLQTRWIEEDREVKFKYAVESNSVDTDAVKSESISNNNEEVQDANTSDD